MANIVVLSLLALLASAEDKKLSNHATTLADNSANLAFRYLQKLLYHLTIPLEDSYLTAAFSSAKYFPLNSVACYISLPLHMKRNSALIIK